MLLFRTDPNDKYKVTWYESMFGRFNFHSKYYQFPYAVTPHPLFNRKLFVLSLSHFQTKLTLFVLSSWTRILYPMLTQWHNNSKLFLIINYITWEGGRKSSTVLHYLILYHFVVSLVNVSYMFCGVVSI